MSSSAFISVWAARPAPVFSSVFTPAQPVPHFHRRALNSHPASRFVPLSLPSSRSPVVRAVLSKDATDNAVVPSSSFAGADQNVSRSTAAAAASGTPTSTANALSNENTPDDNNSAVTTEDIDTPASSSCPFASSSSSVSASSTIHTHPKTASSTAKPNNNSHTGLSLADPNRTDYIPIPSDHRNAVLGVLVDIATRTFRSGLQRHKYGTVYKSNVVGRAVTVVSDLDLISHCYRDTTHTTVVGAFPPGMIKLFGADMLLFVDGPAHVKGRTLMNSAFSPRAFNIYFPHIQASTDLFLSSIATLFESASEKLSGKKKVMVNPESLTRAHFLRVIERITTAASLDSLPREVFESIDYDHEKLSDKFIHFAESILTPPFGPIYDRGIKARTYLLDVMQELVLQRLIHGADVIDKLRNTAGATTKHNSTNANTKSSSSTSSGDTSHDTASWKLSGNELRNDNIDLLTILIAVSPLPTRPDLNDITTLDQLRPALVGVAEVVVYLWFSGYFTQSATFLCSVMELGMDSKKVSLLTAEQDSVPELTIEAVTKHMPLLDSFLFEVLRLWPPAPMLHRKVLHDIDLDGHRVEKDSIIYFDMLMSQRDPKYYDRPEEFDMFRFWNDQNQTHAAESGTSSGAGAAAAGKMISFGVLGGSHFCIGYALAKILLKLALASLLREYEFEVRPWKKERDFIMTPEMYPRDGVHFTKFRKKTKDENEDDLPQV